MPSVWMSDRVLCNLHGGRRLLTEDRDMMGVLWMATSWNGAHSSKKGLLSILSFVPIDHEWLKWNAETWTANQKGKVNIAKNLGWDDSWVELNRFGKSHISIG
jgi:hypothetical protein